MNKARAYSLVRKVLAEAPNCTYSGMDGVLLWGMLRARTRKELHKIASAYIALYTPADQLKRKENRLNCWTIGPGHTGYIPMSPYPVY